MSHELRTPLTVFLGAVKTAMSEGITAEEVRDLLEDASKSAESMAHLVENLLELSRFQANRLVLTPKLLDVAALVRNAVANWMDESYRFCLDIAGGLPQVEVDQLRLEQVLHNLVDNAAKYSSAGTEIRVSIKKESEHLLIGVKDRGKGIPLDQQAKLFQSFERLAETSVTRPGLGLGLLVCKRLVEAHGGKIWVESEPGQRFYILVYAATNSSLKVSYHKVRGYRYNNFCPSHCFWLAESRTDSIFFTTWSGSKGLAIESLAPSFMANWTISAWR